MKNPTDLANRLTASCRLLFACGFLGQFLPLTAVAASAPEVAQKIELKSAGIPGLSQMMPGGFVGKAGNALLVAAPSAAARGDGALSVWTCPRSSDAGEAKSWKESQVNVPSWSASAPWEDRLIVAGGLLGGKSVATVSILSVDGTGAVKSSALPDLPKPLAGAGAAMIGTTLYVFGGISSLEPAVFEKQLWKLEFTDGAPSSTWREGEVFPNSPKAFFAVTAQYGMLCVFGGIGPDLKVSNETWVYRPQPIEATSYIGWKRVGDLPHPSARASAVPLGQASGSMARRFRQPIAQPAFPNPARPDR